MLLEGRFSVNNDLIFSLVFKQCAQPNTSLMSLNQSYEPVSCRFLYFWELKQNPTRFRLIKMSKQHQSLPFKVSEAFSFSVVPHRINKLKLFPVNHADNEIPND